MLKAIAAAIRSAMRKIAKMVLVTVEVGGRLISMMRYGPYAAAEAVGADDPVDQVSQASAGDRLTAMREVVLDYARNPAMPVSRMLRDGVGADTVAWIRSMDPIMLARVSVSTDEALVAHLSGQRSISGVVAYDREAVAEYAAAKRQWADDREFDLENESVLAM